MRLYLNVLLKFFMVFGLYIATVDVVFADISAISQTLTAQITSAASLVKIIGLFAGFLAVLFGINGIIQAKKQQQPMSGPIVTLVIGVALLSSVALANSLSQSTGLGGSSGVSALGLGN